MGTVGTGSSGTRFIRTKFPHEDGLIDGTTKTHGRKVALDPSGQDLTGDSTGI